MSKFEGFIILLVSIMVSIAVVGASAEGAKDRSFPVVDDITGKTHYVTERSIEECKSKPHYSIVNLDGVERRCVQSQKWGATTIIKEK